jgi:hypothetical protein
VTLSSDDPLAVRNWLETHSYVIPPEIEPVIDDYVAEGADFIALRLAPSAGVQQMAPVRVITPGASPVLPLRMVAAGTGTKTSIVLYVLGEGRYQSANFGNVVVDESALRWDWFAGDSNYGELRDGLLTGDRFLTSFAQHGAITSWVVDFDGVPAQYNVGSQTYRSLAATYFAQAAVSCDGAVSLLESTLPVVETCNAFGCADAPAGAIAAIDLACGDATDFAAGLVGMHPSDVWVTRLEASLSRTALLSDLELEAGSQVSADNWHVAQQDMNLPCTIGTASNDDPAEAEDDNEARDGDGCGCAVTPRFPNLFASSAALAALVLFARRRTRR